MEKLIWIKNRVEKSHYLCLVDEADKGCPLDLNEAASAIKELKHEMKEVRLSQVGWRLLGELDPANDTTAIQKRKNIV
jgi:hypothetical protein